MRSRQAILLCAVAGNSKLDEGLCGVMHEDKKGTTSQRRYLSQMYQIAGLLGTDPTRFTPVHPNGRPIQLVRYKSDTHRLRLLLLEELEDLSGEECTATSIIFGSP